MVRLRLDPPITAARRSAPAWTVLAVTGLALLALALALSGLVLGGCRNDTQKDKLNGPLGPGAGGTAVVTPLTTIPLTRPDGVQNGSGAYDATYFVLVPPTPGTGGFGSADFGALDSIPPDGIRILATHISGRPDTPCRFNAAVLARDSGFTIGDTGFRTNDLGQKLYQVNVSAPGTAERLFCAELLYKTGMQFMVSAPTDDKLSWLQVHAVLNSVSP